MAEPAAPQISRFPAERDSPVGTVERAPTPAGPSGGRATIADAVAAAQRISRKNTTSTGMDSVE